MKSRVLWIALTIAIAVFFPTCKKKSIVKEVIGTFQCTVDLIEGEQNDIVGKWKLISAKPRIFQSGFNRLFMQSNPV